jgi:hypothetical protein
MYNIYYSYTSCDLTVRLWDVAHVCVFVHEVSGAVFAVVCVFQPCLSHATRKYMSALHTMHTNINAAHGNTLTWCDIRYSCCTLYVQCIQMDTMVEPPLLATDLASFVCGLLPLCPPSSLCPGAGDALADAVNAGEDKAMDVNIETQGQGRRWCSGWQEDKDEDGDRVQNNSKLKCLLIRYYN